MPEPGWVRDPSGRYHQRYFDGSAWTEHVADEYGRRAVDPVETVQQARPEAAPPRPTSASPPAVAQQARTTGVPRAAPVSGQVVLTLPVLVATAGLVVTLVSFVLLPWLADGEVVSIMSDVRATAFTGAATGASTGPYGVWESSYFDAGWVITLAVLGFTTYQLATRGRPAQPWLSAAVGVCIVWAAASTVLLRNWVDDFFGTSASLDYGFYIGMAGLLAVAVAPFLPERRLGRR